MRKNVKLFLVPYIPGKLEVGILWVYDSISRQETVINIIDENDLNNSAVHEMFEDIKIKNGIKCGAAYVKPYLVSEEQINLDDLCIFVIEIDGDENFVVACPDDLLGDQIKEVFRVVAEPEQIGVDVEQLQKIIDNGGECEIEGMDEFTNPEDYKDVGWGDGVCKPKLVDGKAVIYA